MPTDAKSKNPQGLAKAATVHSDVLSQLKLLTTKLAKSKPFAASFDEAVMTKDVAYIKKLAKQAGVTGRITIDKIDPDRMFSISVCINDHCAAISIEW